MAGDVQQLQELIARHLSAATRVPLVEVLAEFDHHNHSLPATWRWNKAIAAVAQPLRLSADGIHLEPSANPQCIGLTDSDILRIVAAYHEGVASRTLGHGA